MPSFLCGGAKQVTRNRIVRPNEFEEQINTTLEFLKEKEKLLIKKLDKKHK